MHKALSQLAILGWAITILSIFLFSSPAGAEPVARGHTNPAIEKGESVPAREEVGAIETLDAVERIDPIILLIRSEAKAAGVDPSLAVRVAECESGVNPEAKNPTSTATGLYQFLESTWRHIGAETKGLDRRNPEDNLAMFLKHFPGSPGWWAESQHCWDKK